MPTVATQTDITMTTDTGYLGWLKANRDVADGTPVVKDVNPKDKVTKTWRNAYWKLCDLDK